MKRGSPPYFPIPPTSLPHNTSQVDSWKPKLLMLTLGNVKALAEYTEILLPTPAQLCHLITEMLHPYTGEDDLLLSDERRTPQKCHVFFYDKLFSL